MKKIHALRRARLSTLLGTALLSAASVPLISACSSEPETTQLTEPSSNAELGQLQLQLVGVSNSSVVYQLRDAVFSIISLTGGVGVGVGTDANSDQKSLRVELPPDIYEVFLNPGYHLERLDQGIPLAARRASTPAKAAEVAARDGAAPEALPQDPSSGDPSAFSVPSELVSSNPVFTEVRADEVTPLNFVFRVDGGDVTTGVGALDIGIEIIDADSFPPTACTDAYEPNDEFGSPALIESGVALEATLCDTDLDNYVFEPPVAFGEAFDVTVGFSQAEADIDAALFSATTGSPVDVGSSVTDDEVLSAFSDGGPYILQVVPFSMSAPVVSYTIDISQGAPPAEPESDCCTASDVPGCTDPAVNGCTCELDATCCTDSFDDVCVAQAAAECGAQCVVAAPESDCCTASPVPACTLPDVSECVCAIDPFCCLGSFDDSCAALAQSQCGALCDAGGAQ